MQAIVQAIHRKAALEQLCKKGASPATHGVTPVVWNVLHTKWSTSQNSVLQLSTLCLPVLSILDTHTLFYLFIYFFNKYFLLCLCIRHFLSLLFLLLTCTECSLLFLKCKAKSSGDRTAYNSSTRQRPITVLADGHIHPLNHKSRVGQLLLSLDVSVFDAATSDSVFRPQCVCVLLLFVMFIPIFMSNASLISAEKRYICLLLCGVYFNGICNIVKEKKSFFFK